MKASQEIAVPAQALGAAGVALGAATTPPPASPTAFPLNDMISISIDCLEGMRQQCATVAHLTKQQVRVLESKLVRMFAALLVLRSQRQKQQQQHLSTSIDIKQQWLRVIGLSPNAMDICQREINNIDDMLEQSDEQLRNLLSHLEPQRYQKEDTRRLISATQKLRQCRDTLMADSKPINITEIVEIEESLKDAYYWDSWDPSKYFSESHDSADNSNAVASPRRAMNDEVTGSGANISCRKQSPAHELSNVSTTEELPAQKNSTLTLTLTPSPPNSPFTPPTLNTNLPIVGGAGGGSLIIGGSLNSTPQHAKYNSSNMQAPLRHQTLLGSLQSMSLTHVPEIKAISAATLQHQEHTGSDVPLAKSKSNESPFRKASFSAASSPPQSLISATINSNYAGSNTSIVSRTRLNTDPSPESFSSANSDLFVAEDNNNTTNNLQVPRSPCTPIKTGYMSHTIAHRFTKVFKVLSTCDLCQKQMFIGLKCKECKYICHKDCEGSVPPSCGLPREFVDAFKMTLKDDTSLSDNNTASPNSNTLGKIGRRNRSGSAVANTHLDSTSPGSSCHSSSPSSPALIGMHHKRAGSHSGSVSYGVSGANANTMNSSGGGSSSTSSNMLSTPSSYQNKNVSQFNFPDVTITANYNQTLNNAGNTHTILSRGVGGGGSVTESITSEYSTPASNSVPMAPQDYQDSISTFSTFKTGVESEGSRSLTSTLTSSLNYDGYSANGVSIGSGVHHYARKLSSGFPEKPTPLPEFSDTHKSNDSDKTISLSGSASTDSDRTPVRVDSTEDGDSGQWPRQNSVSMKEWDIPYSDIKVNEAIGNGRFGTVHRGQWHGAVAVKLLKEDYSCDEHMLETFKEEVAIFKKTRHENLVLFMGACMNPPHLAIVTSLCNGKTLYTILHTQHQKLNITRSTLVAQQISHGMSYLHARKILHKDLRTKNIFLENGKVVITDFGLVGSTKLLYCDKGLSVPTKGWLCYLAPEIMRALPAVKPSEEILPFDKATDVYAFGTVWYELLCGEFPFKTQPPESVIWQVGRGMKQTLANLHTSRDIKDILMVCWAYDHRDRPDFHGIIKLMDKLPRKRLARSPSHPIQISRSAESVF